jgi:hypothetical protein
MGAPTAKPTAKPTAALVGAIGQSFRRVLQGVAPGLDRAWKQFRLQGKFA